MVVVVVVVVMVAMVVFTDVVVVCGCPMCQRRRPVVLSVGREGGREDGR